MSGSDNVELAALVAVRTLVETAEANLARVKAERAEAMAEARRAGYRLTEIAEAAGTSVGGTHRLVAGADPNLVKSKRPDGSPAVPEPPRWKILNASGKCVHCAAALPRRLRLGTAASRPLCSPCATVAGAGEAAAIVDAIDTVRAWRAGRLVHAATVTRAVAVILDAAAESATRRARAAKIPRKPRTGGRA